jgi:hypothetical protein
MDEIMAAILGAVANVGNQAVKDAYKALKRVLAKKFGRDHSVCKAIDSLEEKPQSTARQQVVREEVEAAKLDGDAEISAKALEIRGLLGRLALSPPSASHQQAGNDAIQIAGVIGPVDVRKA